MKVEERRRWEMGNTDVEPSLFVPFGGEGGEGGMEMKNGIQSSHLKSGEFLERTQNE